MDRRLNRMRRRKAPLSFFFCLFFLFFFKESHLHHETIGINKVEVKRKVDLKSRYDSAFFFRLFAFAAWQLFLLRETGQTLEGSSINSAAPRISEQSRPQPNCFLEHGRRGSIIQKNSCYLKLWNSAMNGGTPTRSNEIYEERMMSLNETICKEFR